MHADTPALLARIAAAINAHDLEELVGCFAADYRNETPVHPSRGFVGQDQVRRNWMQILGGVPDLHAELVRHAEVAGVVWAEWDWCGTRPDGLPLSMRGVTILGSDGEGRAQWARFYMEPVDTDDETVDAAVRGTIGSRP